MKYIVLFLLLASVVWASPELNQEIASYKAEYADFTYIQNPKISVYQVNQHKEKMAKDFKSIEEKILQENAEEEYELHFLKADFNWDMKKIDERIVELKRKRKEFIIWVSILAGAIIAIEFAI